jgi:hypothetical protein
MPDTVRTLGGRTAVPLACSTPSACIRVIGTVEPEQGEVGLGSMHVQVTRRVESVGRARVGVVWIAYIAAFPSIVLLVGFAGYPVLGTAVMVSVLASTAYSPILRDWVHETGQPESRLYLGPWTNAFTQYCLREARWNWPWFNRARQVVFAIGVGGFVVGWTGSLLFGWS